ncbi:MAG: SoxR reducing system RseC family protein [Clostridiales bacterium]|nr:SoxR reducing system RseC family protein [Clostridiales bacterium]
MIEWGTVVKLKGDKAVVRFNRKSACDNCRMCAVTKDGMKVEVVVKNTLNLSVGDSVAVEMGERFVLTAAVIVYIIPLLLVGLGIYLGLFISDLMSAIFAVAGLVLGFIIAISIDKQLKKKKGFSPRMVEEQMAVSLPQESDKQE